MRMIGVLLVLVSLVFLAGCTSTEKGIAFGGIGGAAAGGAIGYFASSENRTDDALVGTAIGAVTGAIAGGIIGYFSGE